MNRFITSGSVRYYTIVSGTERPAGPAHAVATVAGRFFRRFLTTLHETQRRRAELIIARHRHLIADDETTPRRATKTKNPR